MGLIFDGSPVCLSRGAPGPDGNPIGTVISLMGLEAPTDYLVCDGATYNIADYNDLAAYFASQFGSKNYFGGDGTTTFAVPDLRNLFLRGYHGEAEEQLSGDVGVKQEATEIPTILQATSGASAKAVGMIAPYLNRHSPPKNLDTIINESNALVRLLSDVEGTSTAIGLTDKLGEYYTARPVNTAVLYCIKARTSFPAYEQYSTEEQVVGTWIDGKPIYRKTFHGYFAANTTILKNVNELVNQGGNLMLDGVNYTVPFPYVYTNNVMQQVRLNMTTHTAYMQVLGSYVSATFWVEYTKTTD